MQLLQLPVQFFNISRQTLALTRDCCKVIRQAADILLRCIKRFLQGIHIALALLAVAELVFQLLLQLADAGSVLFPAAVKLGLAFVQLFLQLPDLPGQGVVLDTQGGRCLAFVGQFSARGRGYRLQGLHFPAQRPDLVGQLLSFLRYCRQFCRKLFGIGAGRLELRLQGLQFPATFLDFGFRILLMGQPLGIGRLDCRFKLADTPPGLRQLVLHAQQFCLRILLAGGHLIMQRLEFACRRLDPGCQRIRPAALRLQLLLQRLQLAVVLLLQVCIPVQQRLLFPVMHAGPVVERLDLLRGIAKLGTQLLDLLLKAGLRLAALLLFCQQRLVATAQFVIIGLQAHQQVGGYRRGRLLIPGRRRQLHDVSALCRDLRLCFKRGLRQGQLVDTAL